MGKLENIKKKQILLSVSNELHKKIKLLAVENDTSINELVTNWLEMLIKQNQVYLEEGRT